jgi:altronate hydrolase
MNEMDAQARTSENVARAIRLHVNDNIVIARTPLKAGAELREEGVTALGFVGAGHKIATRRIAVGEPIVKYDTVIGFASREIAPGDPVGKDNVGFRDFERDYAYAEGYVPVDLLPETSAPPSWGSCARTGASARATISASSPR